MSAPAPTPEQQPPEYLIWSNEHRAWWAPEAEGYTPSIEQAGRYSRPAALRICMNAMPGAARVGALPELPIRQADVEAMVAAYRARYPDAPEEPWQ